MTRNKRIVLNVLATYGRTLFSIACGLFTVRWVLMALGHESYGLYGVVGSLAMFMNFLNIQLSGSLSRFFAVAIGARQAGSIADGEYEQCQQWFSCGVFIHIVVPLVLVGAGWILGCYAIRNAWLTIPQERVETCVWLWRFVCISSFLGMVNSPFRAMYMAKQYIAELTIYSVAQTIVKTVFIYVMTLIPIDWLWGYGLGICLVTIIPQFIICWRAFYVFPECRLRISFMCDWKKIRQIFAFAGWQTFQGLGYLARHQCLELVVNRHFGPRANAAYTIGSTFGAEAASLTGALNGAFCPVISTAYGARQFDYMRKMAFRACKFGTLLTLMFAVPMFVEVDELLKLWLKDPPEWSSGLCMIMLVVIVVEKLTNGLGAAVDAVGEIAGFKLSRGLLCLTAIPFALLAIKWYSTVYAVGFALLLTTVIVAFSDVYFSCRKAGMRFSDWGLRVVLPIMVLTCVGGLAAWVPTCLIEESFFRVCVTTTMFLVAYLPLAYWVGFDKEEKGYLCEKMRERFARTRLKKRECQSERNGI